MKTAREEGKWSWEAHGILTAYSWSLPQEPNQVRDDPKCFLAVFFTIFSNSLSASVCLNKIMQYGSKVIH